MTIRRRVEQERLQRLASSNWGDFTAFTDDDDEIRIDRTVYAKEEDPQEVKAQVGVGRPAPTIEYDAEPIFVPQGMFEYMRVGHDFIPKHTKNIHIYLSIHQYIPHAFHS